MTDVRRLDIEAARAAVPQLAEILADAVANGDSVSFLIPLSRDDAAAFFESLLPEIERGTRVLLAAFDGDDLVGTVQIAHAWQPNSRHRAEVVKLIVRADRRGGGIGRLLMERLEDEARADGKSLLLLDTVADSVADRLYAKLGWTRIGVIPRYAEDPHGELCAAAFFFKEL
jgi:GNAT superfamily N-acetyltransferase